MCPTPSVRLQLLGAGCEPRCRAPTWERCAPPFATQCPAGALQLNPYPLASKGLAPMRVLARALAVAAILVGCIPTDPCTCLLPPGTAELTGRVEHADSAPALDAVTWSVVYQDTLCSVASSSGETLPVAAGGTFAHRVFTELDRRRCVAVYAAPPGATGRSDSTRSTRVHTFRYREPPDTLAMPTIRLP